MAPVEDDQAPAFRDVYRAVATEVATPVVASAREQTVTMSVESMPLNVFLRQLANQTQVSVVAALDLDQQPVSIDVIDQPASVVIGLVARRLGVQASRSGDAFFLGELRPEDRGVLVRKVGGLSAEQLGQVLAAPLSTEGNFAAFPDGTIVVSDRVEVLDRVRELIDALGGLRPGDWCVQLWVVGLSDQLSQDLGLEAVPALEIAATFATGSTSGSDAMFDLTSSLNTVLRATRTHDRIGLVAEPLFLLRDGETARVSDFQREPIPEVTTTSEGTQLVSGVQFVDAGLNVELALREVDDRSALVDLELELSEVVGFVDSFPRISSRNFSTIANIASGGVYLVGSLEQRADSRGIDGIFRLAERTSATDRRLLIWLRAFRIDTHEQAERPVGGTPRSVATRRAPAEPDAGLSWLLAAFPHHPIDRVVLAAETAVSDGRAGDLDYIAWLLGPADRFE